MIILQKLTWDNCFSYGEGNTLLLDDTTVTQIVGTNGMGKSSIPLIIEEALYNKNSKGIKKADIPNRYVNKGYNIYLSFLKDKTLYEISIDRQKSLKVKLLENGEDISSHTATNTYKSIQKILGVDFKTFSQLVYQNTNASLQFLTATDSNRKKFLIDLLHLEKYVQLFEIFKEAHRASVAEINNITSSLATIVKWLETNKLSDTNILPMQNLEIDTSDIEEALRTLTIELQNISEKNKKISNNNEYKKLLSQVDIIKLQTSTAKHTDYGDILSLSGECEAEIKREQAIVDKLNKLGQECPTCNQQISGSIKQSMITEAATKVKIAEGVRNDLRKRIESIKTENTEYKYVRDSIKTWEELFRNVDSNLQSDLLDKKELERSIALLRTDLQNRKDEISQIAYENETRTRRNTRIQVILEQTDQFKKEKLEIEEKVSAKKKIESGLDILKKSFSTNGLLAYKIESLVKELEDLANHYLGELSDGRFTLEFVVSNDKLNVQITDNGNIVDILALSSGELARVNTATLIAIRKLMSIISKSKINILFLDEVINVLDDTGREKLVEVLTNEKDLNTYIVSHGWTHPLLAKIEVTKQENVSKLETETW
tara:strand:- start:2291 stop:4096 length:1806 start_codon:yes stop_codon:yes gene_type:complete